jgi:signal transduction histidine kinase
LGVVIVFGRLEKQFNLEDVALLSTVADQMGVAVENIRLREQARQAAVLAERERLARELHDSVTQSLYSLTLFAEGALEQAKNGQLEPVQHNLTRIGEAAQQALKEMRLMVYELRPIDLDQEGLVGALHQRLAAVERRAGITARLIAEDLVELPLAVEQELYGMTQEALNNALKHSGASVVTVYLRRVGAEVELAIQDNGYGFDPGEVQDKGGLGLRGLRERVDKVHGVLTIRSAPGQGTTVEVRVRV